MKGDRYLLFKILSTGILTLTFSCGQNNLNQCQQIFRIAREIDRSSENIIRDRDETEFGSWLEAAKMMETAADKIQALHINDSELIRYQNQLATIYRIYARSTYDAVRARENKNLEVLRSARNDARKASQIHQDSVRGLNDYCLNRKN